MKRLAITSALAAMFITAAPAHADDGLFTGDVRLACEAVLCLSSGTRPSECTPSIQKYFSITAKKLSDTIKKRKSFLNLCPAATQDEKMVALVDAITNGAGRCDYASLNSTLRVWNSYEDGAGYISNALPSYCTAYNGNAYTDIKAPRYVGGSLSAAAIGSRQTNTTRRSPSTASALRPKTQHVARTTTAAAAPEPL